jgi:hypothetical protein
VRTRARPSGRPWAWVGGALGLTVLLSSGILGWSSSEPEFVVSPGVELGPEGFPPEQLPPPDLLPPPGLLPGPATLTGPVAVPGLSTVELVDGAGEPFGLPLGTAVVLRDTAGGALELRPSSSSSPPAGELLIDLELRAGTGDRGASVVGVPSVLLRLSDGRELTSTAPVVPPPSLQPGEVWIGRLTFPTDEPGTLVLTDGLAVAGWVVPAAG